MARRPCGRRGPYAAAYRWRVWAKVFFHHERRWLWVPAFAGTVTEGISDMRTSHGPLRIGIGGPPGSGKTGLVEFLCKTRRGGYDNSAGTNHNYTQWGDQF